MLCRCIAPKWLLDKHPDKRRVMEGSFTDDQIKALNEEGYNIYFLPNYPSAPPTGTPVDGAHIDTFKYVFVDFDLKDEVYPSKEAFVDTVLGKVSFIPTRIVDSGGGVHVYWQIEDLDAMSYLRFQRRLMRLFKTDEAVGQIFQLMRLPGTVNTKVEDNFRPCGIVMEEERLFPYTCEDLDKLLPPITLDDEKYCQQHYDKTYNLDRKLTKVTDIMPARFGKLISENTEAKELWAYPHDDRSKADYRLGHLMFANGFGRNEAITVLSNSAKALNRAPVHRLTYAENIVDKIWTFETSENKDVLDLSSSVKDILQRSGDNIKGTRFPCHKRIDNTEHGFRLGQVLGLVAGSGVGKTAFALNMFRWFSQANPDCHHFFIPLEQPANEIADRWQTMCGADESLNDKIHVISNYDNDGNFRHLSFEEIRAYIEKWQEVKSQKIGCVVIDHVGALKKKGAKDEKQDITDICHSMKAFAVQTNTFLVMQSQTSREKAGIGDLELNKDAAYGSIYFESYCDYLVTLWQPLKRCHAERACPTVTAFKFCKIRHKKAKKDRILEDVPYYMLFDSDNEQMRDMTQKETTSFNHFLPKATNKRKADRKTEIVEYTAVPYEGDLNEAEVSNNRQH